MRKRKVIASIIGISIVSVSFCYASWWDDLTPGVDYPWDSASYYNPTIPDFTDDVYGQPFIQKDLAQNGYQVYDFNRTMEKTKHTIQTTTAAINTATQIANQVIALASMSPEALLAHYLGIQNDLGAILGVVHSVQGLMNAADTAQQTWDRAFTQADTFFHGGTSAVNRLNHHQDIVTVLDQTYRDAMNVARTTGNISADAQKLSDIMNNSGSGIKGEAEKQAAIQSISTAAQLKRDQVKRHLLAIIVTKQRADLENEMEAADNAREIYVGTNDPYHPTEQDQKLFTRPAGKGFVRFQ